MWDIIKTQRIKIGSKFLIDESISPELINKATIENYLILPQKVLELEKIQIDSKEINEIVNGREIKISSDFISNITKNLQILDKDDRLIGVGLLTENCVLQPKKIFYVKS